MRTVVALFALACSGADWPQFLGLTRDGTSPEVVRNGDYQVAWSRDLGAGWAGPVAVGGRVFAFHRVGNDEQLDCLDAKTGKEIWTFRARTRYVDDFGFDEGPRATPLITGGKVVTLGADGDLRAVDLLTGKEVWARPLHRDYNVTKGFFGTACSPVAVGNRVLVNVGGKGAGVVAFDLATGKELWKSSDDRASYSSPTVAAVGGKERALFFTRAGLLGLVPATGAVAFAHPWRPRIEASVNAATPLVWGDEVFVSTSYQTGAILLRVKADQLTEVWSSDEVMSNHYNTAVRVKGELYGIHGRQEQKPELACVDWKTGKSLWMQPKFGCAGLIATADGVILAVAEGGDLVAFAASPAAYKELARLKILDAPVRSVPALANGRLFARDGKKLVCVEVGK